MPRKESFSNSLCLTDLILAGVLATLGIACYLNILRNELFLDDLDYIVSNAYIRDWRYWPRMFGENLIAGAGKVSDYYRPAILIAFTFVHSIWELNPVGYHLLSILFHSGCGVLLFFFFMKILSKHPAFAVSSDIPADVVERRHRQRRAVSFGACTLFLCHPVQSEAVASASALGILMGMFFALLALMAYCLARGSKGATAVGITMLGLLATSLALLCKETMVVIPGFVFLVEYFFLSREEGIGKRFGGALLRSAPYLVLVLAYIVLRFSLLNFGGTGNLYRGDNIFTEFWHVRFYTFMAVLTEFFKVIFWPAPLHMERSTVIPIYASPMSFRVLFGIGLFLALIALSVLGLCAAARRSQELADGSTVRNARASVMSGIMGFGALWFLFALVPVSNIFIPISTTMVESWLYVPIAGFLLALSWLALSLLGRSLAATMLITVVIVFSVRTVGQNRIWKDPIAFYEHNLRYAPKSARFRNNLAMAYADEKRYNDSIQQYLHAIEINDQYPETHHNLANSYLAVEKLAEAEREFHNAIRMNTRFHHSYVSLASLYLEAQRSDLAEAVLEDLISNAPSRWEGYYNLGIIHHMKGDHQVAVSLWQKGLSVDPYNPTLRQVLEGKTRGRSQTAD